MTVCLDRYFMKNGSNKIRALFAEVVVAEAEAAQRSPCEDGVTVTASFGDALWSNTFFITL
jgi:hypothetical protein